MNKEQEHTTLYQGCATKKLPGGCRPAAVHGQNAAGGGGLLPGRVGQVAGGAGPGEDDPGRPQPRRLPGSYLRAAPPGACGAPGPRLPRRHGEPCYGQEIVGFRNLDLVLNPNPKQRLGAGPLGSTVPKEIAQLTATCCCSPVASVWKLNNMPPSACCRLCSHNLELAVPKR